jgi:sigma-B regulation protein RsbU (phosphoserine phosphatase)
MTPSPPTHTAVGESRELRKGITLKALRARHRTLRRRYLLLKRGLERAGRMQLSLLPPRPPVFQGYRFTHYYRPCEAVGGDFYDFSQRGEELVLIVSDVVGHGFEAALTIMLMKDTFEETVEATTDPVELLLKMNGRLHRVLPEGMFAATAILKLQSRRADIEFANAGIPYPFLLRASPPRVEQIELAGFPLGLFERVPLPFETRTISLSPGDVLLVGSDGIRAVVGTRGDHFEDDRLPRLLSELAGRGGEELVGRLMVDAKRFGNGTPLPDDLNLLAVTRE